jgi:pimeloyl-ACP methyl ester carboxylesterase
LINASFGGHSRFWERLKPSSYGALLDLLRPGLSVAAREGKILALTSAAPRHHLDVVERWAAFAGEYPVTRANALRQLIAAARYRPAAFTPVPLLVLAGARDWLVSPQCSRRFAAQGGLPFQLHPGAGHDLPLDDPEWVIEQALAWRRENDR